MKGRNRIVDLGGNHFNLCKCLNCDGVFVDTNPQIGARIWNLDELKLNLPDELEDHKCPKCEVDDYLSDDVVESDVAELIEKLKSKNG